MTGTGNQEIQGIFLILSLKSCVTWNISKNIFVFKMEKYFLNIVLGFKTLISFL